MGDRQPISESKSPRSQQAKKRQPQGTRSPEKTLMTQPDHLAQVISHISKVSSPSTHAAIVSRLTVSSPSLTQGTLLQLQRQYGNRYVQRMLAISRQGEGSAEVAPEVEAAIQQQRGGGQALDRQVQAQMESAFGTDFSGVRVHADGEADGLNQALRARAFTTGQDIFFRQGEYEPGSSRGRELLAHELTHVVQQGGGLQRKLVVGQPGDVYEQEEKLPQAKETAGSRPAIFPGIPSRLLDGVPESSMADSLFLLIDGPPHPQITVRPNITTPSILKQPIPPPNTVRVVQNHQFPITASHVAAGWRSGFGGVSEIEVSNGTTDYDGTNISEHFIGGIGNNAQIGGCNNQHGQGGQGGSTFTVGTGVNFSQNGLNVNFPPKHNRFYDLHLKGFGTNILPTGTNFQFSLCIQRYSFGGNTILGRLGGLLPAIFTRWHGIERSTVGGQDVASINLVKF